MPISAQTCAANRRRTHGMTRVALARGSRRRGDGAPFVQLQTGRKRVQKFFVVAALLMSVSACREEGVTPGNAINLAGCDVPAGISSAEAEAITCDPASAAVDETVQVVPDHDVIDAAIATQALRDGGSEYVEGRRVVVERSTDGASEQTAVLFMLEGAGGGNGSVGYLAGFSRRDGELAHLDTMVVGGFGAAAHDICLEDGIVHVDLLVQGSSDPACCPTEAEVARYLLRESGWLQVH